MTGQFINLTKKFQASLMTSLTNYLNFPQSVSWITNWICRFVSFKLNQLIITQCKVSSVIRPSIKPLLLTKKRPKIMCEVVGYLCSQWGETDNSRRRVSPWKVWLALGRLASASWLRGTLAQTAWASSLRLAVGGYSWWVVGSTDRRSLAVSVAFVSHSACRQLVSHGHVIHSSVTCVLYVCMCV